MPKACSSGMLRFDAAECPVVHANMIMLTRGGQGSTRVFVF
jgi:hypothetical protein